MKKGVFILSLAFPEVMRIRGRIINFHGDRSVGCNYRLLFLLYLFLKKNLLCKIYCLVIHVFFRALPA